MKFEMVAEVREAAGKGPARQLRKQGKVPGVLYGQGECLLLTLDPAPLSKILRAHAGSTALFSLKVTGTKTTERTALLRDWQIDPITGGLLHVDLFEVSMTKEIRVKVPVSLIGGTPIGLKEGGVLHHNLRVLNIECLPGVLPEAIEVDASALKINQGIHVKELSPGKGIKLLDEGDQMVVSVAAPITEAKLEALLTSGMIGEEGKEPEVIGKAKEEGVAVDAPGDKKDAKDAKDAKGEKKDTKEEKKK